MLRAPILRAATGRFSILVFRDGRFVRAVGVIKRRLSLGSGALCDISLEGSGLAHVWGTIVDRGAEVVLEPEGHGPRRAFPFHEPVALGSFVLVRVPAGADLAREIADFEALLQGGRAETAPADAGAPEEDDSAPGAVEASLEPLAEDATAPGVASGEAEERGGGPDLEDLLEDEPPAQREAPRRSLAPFDGPRTQAHAAPPPPPPPRPSSAVPAPEASLSLGRSGGAGAGGASATSLETRRQRAEHEPRKPEKRTGGLASEQQSPARSAAPAPAARAASPAGAPRPAPAPVLAAPGAPPDVQAMGMPQMARAKSAGPASLAASAAGMAVGGVAALASAALARDLASSDSEGAGGSSAIARRTTVRHYTQMNPGRTYPLLVIISAGKVERVVMEEVAQVESEVAFTVTRESPMVRIEPILPGCAVAPTSIEIDCTAELAEARFHVTPIVEGVVAEARIEVRHEGKLVDTVPVPTRVAAQTVAKVSASFSAATPFAMQVLRLADKGGVDRSDLAGATLGRVHDMAAWAGGPTKLGLLIAVCGALVALLAYLRNRAREGSPIVRFLDYSAQMGAAEDLAVERLKAVLVLFTDGLPSVVPVRRRRLTIGSAPDCDVVLKHRGIAEHHAELRVEGGRMTLAAVGGAPLSLRGAGSTAEVDLTGKDEACVSLGALLCLYIREVRDEVLDGEGGRDEVVQTIAGRLVGKEAHVQAAFADRTRPARASAVALMRAGFLDEETWRRACGSAAARRRAGV